MDVEAPMDQQVSRQLRRRFLTEKLLVELVAVAALAGVFYLAAPLLRGPDPQAAMSFLVDGGGGRFAAVAGGTVALAALCGAVMVFARPEGAVVALLAGLAGVSAFSTPIRTLLWPHYADVGGFYVALGVELAATVVVIVIAVIVADCVRRAVTPLAGSWAWRSPLTCVDVPVSAWPEVDRARLGQLPLFDRSPTLAMLLWGPASVFRRSSQPDTSAKARALGLRNRAAGAAMTLVIALVLLGVLLQSDQRRQLLFAVFGSFLVASLIAHYVFPSGCSVIYWLMPALIGLGACGLGMLASETLDPRIPTDILERIPGKARALPIDWLAAGGAGAAIGYLISIRLHEAKIVEHMAEAAEADSTK